MLSLNVNLFIIAANALALFILLFKLYYDFKIFDKEFYKTTINN